jgi:dienelactone hydrolase
MERQFDTLVYSHARADDTVRELAFAATTRSDAETWQARLRGRLRDLVGGLDADRVPLEPEVHDVRDFSTYTRETVYLQSRPGLSIFGYFLRPKDASGKTATVVCLPGHGRGVDDIVGINEDGTVRSEYGGYQFDFALQCVAHGYNAFAVEQFGFGHRRDAAARRSGGGASSCQPSSGAAFLLGETMVGWRVWDVIRSLDYLEMRPEVDASRLAVMGISGGGTITFFSAALDTRLKAAVVSGYFNTFRDSILSISHCIDNYVPGILRVAEMYDIAGCIAPRALFIESGTKDTIFPIEATKASYERARAVYDVFGVAECIGLEVFQADHRFWGIGAFAFLAEHL